MHCDTVSYSLGWAIIYSQTICFCSVLSWVESSNCQLQSASCIITNLKAVQTQTSTYVLTELKSSIMGSASLRPRDTSVILLFHKINLLYPSLKVCGRTPTVYMLEFTAASKGLWYIYLLGNWLKQPVPNLALHIHTPQLVFERYSLPINHESRILCLMSISCL